MKLCLTLAVVSVLVICACTTSPVARNSAQQKIQAGGHGYLISQLTAGTWTVAAQDGKPVPRSSMDRAALIDAVARTSGCKVTDVNYSRDGLQLDALVDCGGLPGN